MEFTGERFVPGVHGVIEIEHVHRYLCAARIAAGKSILDIASGEGYGSAMLAAHAAKVIGVDISPEAIEHARTRYQRDNLEFRVGTCADFPLDNASVDLVVSFETLEHHDQHDRMMEEVKRVLRPGGLLLLSSPDKLHYTIEPRRLNPYHVKELYKGEFEDLLSRHFKQTAYFAQRIFYGSGIFASQTSGSLNSYLLSKDVVKEFSGVIDPTYWIAIASDGPLPSISSSVLEQPIDESELLLQLKQAVSASELQMVHLTDGLRHRDGQIASLTHSVTEFDRQVVRLTERLGYRDEQIANLTQGVTERDTQIIDLIRRMGERDREIASLVQGVTEYEARIVDLTRGVNDRDEQIASLTQRITEREKLVVDLNRQLESECASVEAQERWENSLLRAAAFAPLSLRFPNAWVGHLPFAAWLMETFSPGIFVELGTHSGNSFFSFCQAVAQSGNSTRCYAVDTWRGDEHAGHYDESIFDYVSDHQQQHYREFSRLLRMTFDEARDYFSDASVGLLHIDGLHTYEAVRSDFETWLPKLAPGAVVLFHDTNVHERNFGVWKLWEELQQVYPLNLEFLHSHGLGVLQLNNAPDKAALPWLAQDSLQKQKVLEFFSALGARQLDRAEALELREHIAEITRKWTEHNGHILYRDGQIAHLNHVLKERENQLAALTEALAERSEQVAQLTSSRSWRVTSPMRALGRIVRHAPPKFVSNGIAPTEHQPVASEATEQFDRMQTLFDAAWYLKENPDVKATGIDPWEHFTRQGATEGRSPHPLFDSQWYLRKNPQIRDAGKNPVSDFVEEGWKAGRNPHPLFDVRWYLDTNPDVRGAGFNPLQHFIEFGAAEGRKPHPLFDTSWYLEKNEDVRAAGQNALVHFLETGWTEGRNPNPDFNLSWYLDSNPDVRGSRVNPLIHYVEFGAAEGRQVKPQVPTHHNGAIVADSPRPRRPRPENGIVRGDAVFDIKQYLQQGEPAFSPPPDVRVDIIVPVYRGLEETRRCIMSVLADADDLIGSIRVINDCSPEPELSEWLTSLEQTGAIDLTINDQNMGFLRTVNRGMTDAGRHDVVLLNSDTEVPKGFVRRLAGYAYSKPNIGSVTPFSNTGGEMAGFPGNICQGLPPSYSMTAIDQACQTANGQRSIEIPTGVGFCLYIRRACLDEVGLFDAEAFGRGYGEETDFCQRALDRGWSHLLACNTFVYHEGEVSFGQNAPERSTSWNKLVSLYPDLAAALNWHLAGQPTVPSVFAATAALFRASPHPTVLIVHHNFQHNGVGPLDDLTEQTANVLSLRVVDSCLELSVPSIPGHPIVKFPSARVCDLLSYLNACAVSRIHIQHWVGIGELLHELIDRLGVPVDLTVHDYFSA